MFFLKELPTQSILQHYSKMFPEMDIEKTASTLRMLRKASILSRKLEQYFLDNGLSLTRFLILIVLDREQDVNGLSMRQIIERIDISKPVMTRTIQALVSDKLVELSADSNDSRLKLSKLTPEGRAKLHSVLPGYYQLINKEFSHEAT